MNETEPTRTELERRLAALDEEFAREMKTRGFQPDQAENVPLTPELARLYSRRVALSEELEALEGTREESTNE